jgi:hypothetical protein
MDTAASRPTSPPRGPMTRARAQALRQEVNSLLSTYDFDTPLDGLLLHANTLCSIRYIDQDTSHGDQGVGERAGNDEDGATAHRPELPPPRTGTSGQIPPRCPQDALQRAGKSIGPELPPRGTGTSARSELPPKFRPSSESPRKGPWMLLQGNGRLSELGRNLAGTSGQAGTSGPQDRNFRPRRSELPPPRTSAQQYFSACNLTLRPPPINSLVGSDLRLDLI